jgi:pterin-4a-carbinolamine dehydratase
MKARMFERRVRMQQTSESRKPATFAATPERMRLKPERIQQLLLELPGWKLGVGGRVIVRRRELGSPAEAAEYAGLAGKLAACQRQPVTIALAGTRVVLTLAGHPIKGCTGGLTNPVFRLAAILG